MESKGFFGKTQFTGWEMRVLSLALDNARPFYGQKMRRKIALLSI